jgi:transposase-like protein
MKVAEFQVWLDAVEQLSADQRSVLRAALESSDGGVLERILSARAATGQSCVRCGSDRVIGWGSAHGLPRFRCKDCRRTYNPLTGTSLARLKKRSRWGRHSESLRRGEVLREVAGACGVHISTAHRWRHRFLAATLYQGAEVNGIVEVDETWVSRSAKGQTGVRRSWGRLARRRASDQGVRGRSPEQIFVVVARDRSGNTWDGVVDQVSTRDLIGVLSNHIAKDSVLCSDGWQVYRRAAAKLEVKYEVLNGRAKERRRGPFHLQNVNNYHGRWKGWMHRFRGVASSYLPNYVAWFRHMDANARNSDPKIMLELALAA